MPGLSALATEIVEIVNRFGFQKHKVMYHMTSPL